MFSHLHTHSHYSILTALGKPQDIVDRAKKLNMTALALTDHSVTYGFIEFYKACKKAEIKPLLGCDMNLLDFGQSVGEEIQGRPQTFSIVLLAQNYTGYQNILKLSTAAQLDGDYHIPCIDHDLLKKHSEGVLILIGGFSSTISKALLEKNETKAQKYFDFYKECYGEENVYIELNHAFENDQNKEIEESLKQFVIDQKAKYICAHPSYYLEEGNAVAHDVLLCIREGSIVHDDNRYQMKGNYSLVDEGQMKEWFQGVENPFQYISEVVDKCNVELPLGQSLIPKFDTPDDLSEDKYLRQLCGEGLKNRYEVVTPELQERLDYELGIIHNMGFDGYFLIVWDFINYSRENNIMVGPGRGSAAGSMVAYTLGITNIDPIQFGLIFERFLNPERVSMPDIDVDFIDTKRDRVIKYVQEKYGEDRVAQIITFGTMAARGAVRDCGRALGYSYGTVDRIAKAISSEPSAKLAGSLETEVALQQIYKEPESKKIIDAALQLEGAIRNTSVHAAAVVIAKEDLTETTALQEASKGENSIVTQYSMNPIDELGLLKMDFLGLRNLSIIERATDIIKEIHGISIDVDTLPLDDKNTYDLFSEGETTGVFQFESGGMRKHLKSLQPSIFEDLIAMVSLYRPGPMDSIGDFVEARHGRKKVTYLHPILKPILEKTYGVIVYQEQVFEIARMFSGFTYGEADILRKAVGKKIKKLLDEQKDKFIKGAITLGHSEELASSVWDFIEPFARYGFNKSHAAAYAMISYQTAYLKANYPVEYMAALLTSDSGNMDKIILEVADCNRMEIEILAPSLNHSCENFSVSPDGKAIRFGLSAIKNIGEGPANAILEARTEHGEFETIGDFVSKVNVKFVNKKVLESLAKVGVFDDFAERNQILENINLIIDFAKQSHKNKDSIQIDLFASIGNNTMKDLILPEMVPATQDEKLLWEKELIGVYVSSHPLSGLETYLQKYTTSIISLNDLPDDSKMRIGGIITYVKQIMTKAGQPMAFIKLEDQTSEMEAVVFPRSFEGMKDFLEEGNMIVAEATITTREYRDEKSRSLIINKMRLINVEKARKMKESEEEVDVKKINEKGVIKEGVEKEPQGKTFSISIPAHADAATFEQVKKILEQHPGNDQGFLSVSISNDSMRKIPIPFGVNWNKNIENSISDFLDV